MSIDIDVDRDLCIGSATCTRLAPGVFVLDDEEIATVEDAGAAGIDKVRLAADACPTRAIMIAQGADGDRA